MIVEVWEFIPGSIACLLYLRPHWLTGESIAAVYKAKGDVVVGRRDKPLADMGWPDKIVEEIQGYFDKVFSLEHENWKGDARESPRAKYLAAAKPWLVQVQLESENAVSTNRQENATP